MFKKKFESFSFLKCHPFSKSEHYSIHLDMQSDFSGLRTDATFLVSLYLLGDEFQKPISMKNLVIFHFFSEIFSKFFK